MRRVGKDAEFVFVGGAEVMFEESGHCDMFLGTAWSRNEAVFAWHRPDRGGTFDQLLSTKNWGCDVSGGDTAGGHLLHARTWVFDGSSWVFDVAIY